MLRKLPLFCGRQQPLYQPLRVSRIRGFNTMYSEQIGADSDRGQQRIAIW